MFPLSLQQRMPKAELETSQCLKRLFWEMWSKLLLTKLLSPLYAKYGERRLRVTARDAMLSLLFQTLKQRAFRGNGSGMDDQVQGMIGRDQPVAVSPGEYIVAADVVSGLGEGSTDAGVKELDKMMDKVAWRATAQHSKLPELMKGK